MKVVLILLIGIVIGAAAGTTISVLAKPEPTVARSYDEGFTDGRTDGYHAATRDMDACFNHKR
jgi:hypothetical protein